MNNIEINVTEDVAAVSVDEETASVSASESEAVEVSVSSEEVSISVQDDSVEVAVDSEIIQIKPTATINITDNGSVNVQDYGTAIVDVHASGTINITANGNVDVKNYASAVVNVPSEEPALKTLTVTENGTYVIQDDITVVESMTLTGSAYCNLSDITPPDNCSWTFEAKYVCTATCSGSERIRLFGSTGTTGQNTNKFTLFQKSDGFSFIAAKKNYSVSLTPVVNTEYTLTFDGTKFKVNGVTGTTVTETGSADNTTLDLFACHLADGTHSDLFKGIFKYLKINKHWYVPARKSDNTPMIYEKVFGNAYAMTGTGITLGTDVSAESYDGFASPLTVNVTGIPSRIKEDGSLNLDDVSDAFSDITSLASYALYYAYMPATTTSAGITAENLNWENLASVAAYSMYYAFARNSNIKKATFPALETIASTYALYGCFMTDTKMTEISFAKLKTVSANYALGSICYGCTSLAEVSFPELTSVSGTYVLQNAFYNCKALTEIEFPKLATINTMMHQTFYSCTALTSVSFPALTSVSSTAFGSSSSNYAFRNCTQSGLTIHFPASMQSTIEALTGYSAKFGATNATISFDL